MNISSAIFQTGWAGRCKPARTVAMWTAYSHRLSCVNLQYTYDWLNSALRICTACTPAYRPMCCMYDVSRTADWQRQTPTEKNFAHHSLLRISAFEILNSACINELFQNVCPGSWGKWDFKKSGRNPELSTETTKILQMGPLRLYFVISLELITYILFTNGVFHNADSRSLGRN